MTHEIHLHFSGFTDNGGRSDKVYVIRLERYNDRYWCVSAQWGRRGGKMSSQNKGMYASHWAAVAAFNSLASQKMDKGYEVTSRCGSFCGNHATA